MERRSDQLNESLTASVISHLAAAEQGWAERQFSESAFGPQVRPASHVAAPQLASTQPPTNEAEGEATASVGAAHQPAQPNPQQAEAARRRSHAGSSSSGDELQDAARLIEELSARPEQGLILTPSRLRTDSRVVASTALMYALFALFCFTLLIKVEGHSSASWYAIFIPFFVACLQAVPVRIYMLLNSGKVMLQQVGPPPPVTASAGLHIQYELVLGLRVKTHVCDHVSGILQHIGTFTTAVVFAWALQTGRLGDSLGLRTTFIPIWITWGMTVLLNQAKDRSERSIITLYDLFNAFLFLVAFKADDATVLSWKLVFIIPWVWFAIMGMLAAVLGTALILARAWTRVRELMLPIGFTLFLLGNIPMFLGCADLASQLDGDDGVQFQGVLIPILVSLLTLSLGAIAICVGLRSKEQVRLALLASGAVWTAHEAVARRLQVDREAAQRHIENLSDEQLARMVQAMVAGKVKPGRLMRMGATLYKRIIDEDSIKDQAQAAASAGSTAAGVASKPAAAASIGTGDVSRSHSLRVTSTPDHTVITLPGAAEPASAPGADAASQQQQSEAGALCSDPLQSAGQRVGSQRNQYHTVPVIDEEAPDAAARDAAGQAGGGAGGLVQPSRASVAAPAASRPGSALRRPGAAGPGAGTASTLTGLMDGGLLGLSQPNQVTDADAEADDTTCVICYEEGVARCVLLECGHGGFCTRCAHLLFVRPPNECPTCRARIDQVVELEQPVGPVGSTARVKP